MNILIALSQLEVTGAEVYAVSLANKLIEMGHEVFIVSDTLKTAPKTRAHYIPAPLSKRSIPFRIKNVLWVIRFIKENDIHFLNAHSRASAWVLSVARRFTKIPLVVFIHGRQSTFLSRKLFHGYGNYTIAICEKIEEQLVRVFRVPKEKIEITRNGFDLKKLIPSPPPITKTVSLIGRLSGPKGELAYKILDYFSENLLNTSEFENVKMKVVGGENIPQRFQKFQSKIEFTGFVDGLENLINNSSVVVGSGRIAMESIILQRPTVAIGEACTIGLVTAQNIEHALATNFGDMNENEKEFDFHQLAEDVKRSIKIERIDPMVIQRVRDECDIEKTSSRLINVFESVNVRYYEKEIPVLCYHRVIKNASEAGKHGIYVTAEQFDEHINYLNTNGFKTLSIQEALEIKRKKVKGNYVIITFDDGYEDNYFNAFPILKKHGYKSLIFLVTDLNKNFWDCRNGEKPLSLLNSNQIREMSEYGIDFGSHTLSHKDLTKIPVAEAMDELCSSKEKLENLLGKDVETFAYPYGNLNDEIKNLVKECGYSFAFASDDAPLGLHEDLFQIRRIGVFPNTNKYGFVRKVNGHYTFRKTKKKSFRFIVPNKLNTTQLSI